MAESNALKIIVSEEKGIEVLSDVEGVEVILVKPGQKIPDAEQDAEVLVVGPAEKQEEVDAAMQQIDQLPQLRLLQTLGQGVEQWSGLLPNTVTLSTARGAHGGSTAEWVVAALLSMVRELPRFAENQKAHRWQGNRTRTLQAMNIVIYGAGDVGVNIQRRLEPFGAHITMVGAHKGGGIIDVAAAKSVLPIVDAVITVLPLTAETKKIVDAEFLASLRDGAIVINAGRGGLIDHDALLADLQSGRLQAALDVITPEPLPASSPLWDMPGLVLTPHVAGNTDGADDRAWYVAKEQLQAFMKQM